MVNPEKVVDRILGDEHLMDLSEYECELCGKTITYPTYRFGRPLCAACAKKGDDTYYKNK